MTPQTYPLYATTIDGVTHLVVAWTGHGDSCWPYAVPLGGLGQAVALYESAKFTLTPPEVANPDPDQTAVLSTIQAR